MADRLKASTKGLFGLSTEGFTELQAAIANFAGNVGPVIDKVLFDNGEIIMNNIKALIHPSGRTWDGKKKSAKLTDPFKKEEITMGVAVKTKKEYYYLYFPNEGTKNQRKQAFAKQGLEQSAVPLINLCIDALTKLF